jgi:hypothetical protein
MQQQINLHKFVIYPVQSTLDAKRLLTLYGVFFALLMGFYLLCGMLKVYDEHQLSTLKTTLEAARKTLTATAEKYPDTAIASRFLAAHRQPLCNVKFSAFMQAFAKAIIPGTWLTEIDMKHNGKEISLKGHSLQAGFAQQFLIELKQQPLLAHYNFELTNLTQVADTAATENPAGQPVDFQLTAKMGGVHE